MKYRDHVGGLNESLKTVKEIGSVEELKDYLNDAYRPIGKQIDEIKFEYLGMDKRTGWDTYYVLQRFLGETHFTVAGMSDSKI